MMRLGVVSDTHNNLRNVRQIVELFNAASVDHVIHTGDITQPKTLEVFADLLVPMSGVYGNNDMGELPRLEAASSELGFSFIEPPLWLEWSGRKIVVVHDPLDLSSLDLSNVELTLHGHTHMQTISDGPGGLTFNPGECAGMLKGHNSVGVVELESLKPEILTF